MKAAPAQSLYFLDICSQVSEALAHATLESHSTIALACNHLTIISAIVILVGYGKKGSSVI